VGERLSGEEIATTIIEWVRGKAPGDPGVETRDRNDRLLVAAYGRAFRCFSSIRQLAVRGEADDATVLSRTLLSITLQSLYLAAPDEPEERDRRFKRAGMTYYKNLLKAAREEAAAGVVSEAEVLRVENIIRQLAAEGITELPTEYDIAASLELGHAYTRVYRPGSDVAHYSVGAALDGFLELTREELIGPVALEMPDPKRAEDALVRAGLVYGIFLENCDKVIGHGLTERVRELFVRYFREAKEQDEASST
jgi:hypothetical protein